VATLAQLRAKLNGELGVVNDTEATPWSSTVRDNAIIDGYAELWRAGVWKHVSQDVATVADTFTYALTDIRRLDRIDLLDSSSRLLESPKAVVEDTGSATWQLRLTGNVTLDEGYTMRVRGWTAYKSQFSGDSDTDDLPAEHNRVPLLKAKAILYRIQLGMFARYGERQALPPEMNLSIDQFIGMIAAAEREFEEEARRLSNLRPRSGQARRI
jgi:hypothetical protein